MSNISNLPPIVTPEEATAISKFFEDNPELKRKDSSQELRKNNLTRKYFVASDEFDPNEVWFQTFAGIRFTPLKPNPNNIVIQDIAHALSMQCRFTGHTKEFYSVAQHCVLVSHLCDWEDRLWGLLHDASETYISDFSQPLKHSGQFENYITYEKALMKAICERFNLIEEEPVSVKRADKILLAMEARDLLVTRPDWVNQYQPIPLKIEPWDPKKAETNFLDRFYELIG